MPKIDFKTEKNIFYPILLPQSKVMRLTENIELYIILPMHYFLHFSLNPFQHFFGMYSIFNTRQIEKIEKKDVLL